jgi:hypothetical protein
VLREAGRGNGFWSQVLSALFFEDDSSTGSRTGAVADVEHFYLSILPLDFVDDFVDVWLSAEK